LFLFSGRCTANTGNGQKQTKREKDTRKGKKQKVMRTKGRKKEKEEVKG
jgi:hypothetical protein